LKIVAFGAHPDDIEIGASGTLAKHAINKDKVLMVVVTIPRHRKERIKESKESAKILNAELMILDLDPYKLEFNRQLVEKFDEIIKNISPDIIFTHWNHDSHQDHYTVSKATIAAARENNCSLYMYEQIIPGGIVPYSFRAQYFVDISNFITTKMESIAAYKSETKKHGNWWLEGIKGRAITRGYQIHTLYAEAFEVVKIIDKP
jgi:LmbE family N-acetylglucosaminyl deacetylase